MNTALNFSPRTFAMNLDTLSGVIPQVHGRCFATNELGDEPGGGSKALVEQNQAQASLLPRPELPQHEISQFIRESENVLAVLRNSDSKLAALSPKLSSGQAIQQRFAEIPLNPFVGGNFKFSGYSHRVFTHAGYGMATSLAVSYNYFFGDVFTAGASAIFLFGMAAHYAFELKDAEDEKTVATGETSDRPVLIEGFEGMVYGLIGSLGVAHFVSWLPHLLIATPLAAVLAPGRLFIKRYFQRKQLKDSLQSLKTLTANHNAMIELFWQHPKLMEEYVGSWLPKRLQAQIDALNNEQISLVLKRDRLKADLAELGDKEGTAIVREAVEEMQITLESVEQRLAVLRETRIPRAEQNLRELVPVQERVKTIVAEWNEAQRVEGKRLDALEIQEQVKALATTGPRFRVAEVHEIVERAQDLASSAAELDEYLVEEDGAEAHRLSAGSNKPKI